MAEDTPPPPGSSPPFSTSSSSQPLHPSPPPTNHPQVHDTPPPSTSNHSIASTYPHLSHYISHLLQTAHAAPNVNGNGGATSSSVAGSGTTTPTNAAGQHPLSLSTNSTSEVEEDEFSENGEEEDPVALEKSSSRAAGQPTDQPVTPTLPSRQPHPDPSDPSHLSSPIELSTAASSSVSSRKSSLASHGSLSGQLGKLAEKEELIRRVAELLGAEEEEEVKGLLKGSLGAMGKDDALMEQICLDLMHKHKDDLDHIPYHPSLTPTRPRSTQTTHSHPLRPFTPSRTPSFRARTPISARNASGPTPSSSMNVQPITPGGTGGFSYYQNYATPSHSPLPGGSPLSSPRLLNAKAINFSPGSANSVPMTAFQLPPPTSAGVDPWFSPSSRSASPAPGMTRSASNLALVAPLTSSTDDIASFAFHHTHLPSSDSTGMARSQSSGGQSSDMDAPPVDDIFSSANFSLAQSSLDQDFDEDYDEFSPFGVPFGSPTTDRKKLTPSTSPTAVASKLKMTAKAFDPTRLSASTSGIGAMAGSGRISPSAMALGMAMQGYFDAEGGGGEAVTPGGTVYMAGQNGDAGADGGGGDLGSGMTPLDVLSSVFTSLPAGELEDALARSGYEFEGAMALLIAQNGGSRSGSTTPQRLASPAPRPAFGRLASGGRERDAYFSAGGRGGLYPGGGNGSISPRFGMGGSRSPGPGGMHHGVPAGVMIVGGQRVCRYYLAGECRRADCKFSHDVDRALCRFWLRGQCAKGDGCEFIHTLPNVDPNILHNAMSRIELSQDGSHQRVQTPPADDFPELNMSGPRGIRPAFDPGRNRFANAVKRPMPPAHMGGMTGPGGRFGPAAGAMRRPPMPPPPPGQIIAPIPLPRPSPRIKLRPPTLLPTLPTGGVVNEAYMEARAVALRLGQARNACLARAADAWRRGDGAAAKRFSREANVLNEKMSNESTSAAQQLLRDRKAVAQDAIRARGDWSDAPGDRAVKGKDCAGGLGVIMGIAGMKAVAGGESLGPEERTECLLDLHALHANEASDVLEEFLVNLEKENFTGLAYIIIGDERHTGTQDPARGASKLRLSAGVKQFLARWGYPWSEGGGVLCVDAATHF